MKQSTSTANQTGLSVNIPVYNRRDVEFLQEIEKAHNHDSLVRISGEIERAFKLRIEDEFIGDDITPKTRADITAFCQYLLSIAKLYGYNLTNNKFITTAHGEMFSIATNSPGKITSLLDATFTYFDQDGNYQSTANGLMRCDWASAPSDPAERHRQILRDNNDSFPGLGDDNSEKYLIHIEIAGQFPLLVLPVK